MSGKVESRRHNNCELMKCCFQWHPIRSVIASVSNGIVSIWSQNQVVSSSNFITIDQLSRFKLNNIFEYIII